MTVTLDYRTPEHVDVVRARLTWEMVQAEADYHASVATYINAAITSATAPAIWAAEAAESLREAAIVNDVATARWAAIRSQLAQLPPHKRLGINHNNNETRIS